MKDLCATCDIPERDYDPSNPEYFFLPMVRQSH